MFYLLEDGKIINNAGRMVDFAILTSLFRPDWG
jgi:hypothetical protein